MNPFDALLDAIRQAVREKVSSGIKSQPKPKLTLNTKEAAAILNVPETWLATAAREGRIPVVRIGHYVRFRPADLEAFTQSLKMPSEDKVG